MCSVTDEESKRQEIFIPKGRGLIKGWDLLTTKLGKLGIKGEIEERRVDEGNKELHAEREVKVKEGENQGDTLSGKILYGNHKAFEKPAL